jgi:hypothetical protein
VLDTDHAGLPAIVSDIVGLHSLFFHTSLPVCMQSSPIDFFSRVRDSKYTRDSVWCQWRRMTACTTTVSATCLTPTSVSTLTRAGLQQLCSALAAVLTVAVLSSVCAVQCCVLPNLPIAAVSHLPLRCSCCFILCSMGLAIAMSVITRTINRPRAIIQEQITTGCGGNWTLGVGELLPRDQMW